MPAKGMQSVSDADEGAVSDALKVIDVALPVAGKALKVKVGHFTKETDKLSDNIAGDLDVQIVGEVLALQQLEAQLEQQRSPRLLDVWGDAVAQALPVSPELSSETHIVVGNHCDITTK